MPRVRYIHQEKRYLAYRDEATSREHVEAQKKYLQMLKDDKIEQVTYFE
jgi:hypothetical protein